MLKTEELIQVKRNEEGEQNLSNFFLSATESYSLESQSTIQDHSSKKEEFVEQVFLSNKQFYRDQIPVFYDRKEKNLLKKFLSSDDSRRVEFKIRETFLLLKMKSLGINNAIKVLEQLRRGISATNFYETNGCDSDKRITSFKYGVLSDSTLSHSLSEFKNPDLVLGKLNQLGIEIFSYSHISHPNIIKFLKKLEKIDGSSIKKINSLWWLKKVPLLIGEGQSLINEEFLSRLEFISGMMSEENIKTLENVEKIIFLTDGAIEFGLYEVFQKKEQIENLLAVVSELEYQRRFSHSHWTFDYEKIIGREEDLSIVTMLLEDGLRLSGVEEKMILNQIFSGELEEDGFVNKLEVSQKNIAKSENVLMREFLGFFNISDADLVEDASRLLIETQQFFSKKDKANFLSLVAMGSSGIDNLYIGYLSDDLVVDWGRLLDQTTYNGGHSKTLVIKKINQLIINSFIYDSNGKLEEEYFRDLFFSLNSPSKYFNKDFFIKHVKHDFEDKHIYLFMLSLHKKIESHAVYKFLIDNKNKLHSYIGDDGGITTNLVYDFFASEFLVPYILFEQLMPILKENEIYHDFIYFFESTFIKNDLGFYVKEKNLLEIFSMFIQTDKEDASSMKDQLSNYLIKNLPRVFIQNLRVDLKEKLLNINEESQFLVITNSFVEEVFVLGLEYLISEYIVDILPVSLQNSVLERLLVLGNKSKNIFYIVNNLYKFTDLKSINWSLIVSEVPNLDKSSLLLLIDYFDFMDEKDQQIVIIGLVDLFKIDINQKQADTLFQIPSFSIKWFPELVALNNEQVLKYLASFSIEQLKEMASYFYEYDFLNAFYVLVSRFEDDLVDMKDEISWKEMDDKFHSLLDKGNFENAKFVLDIMRKLFSSKVKDLLQMEQTLKQVKEAPERIDSRIRFESMNPLREVFEYYLIVNLYDRYTFALPQEKKLEFSRFIYNLFIKNQEYLIHAVSSEMNHSIHPVGFVQSSQRSKFLFRFGSEEDIRMFFHRAWLQFDKEDNFGGHTGGKIVDRDGGETKGWRLIAEYGEKSWQKGMKYNLKKQIAYLNVIVGLQHNTRIFYDKDTDRIKFNSLEFSNFLDFEREEGPSFESLLEYGLEKNIISQETFDYYESLKQQIENDSSIVKNDLTDKRLGILAKRFFQANEIVQQNELLPEEVKMISRYLFNKGAGFSPKQNGHALLGRLFNTIDIDWLEQDDEDVVHIFNEGNSKLIKISIEGYYLGFWYKDGKLYLINTAHDLKEIKIELSKITKQPIVDAQFNYAREGD